MPESSGVDRSRRIQQRWPWSTCRPSRRLVSRAPPTACVHQEEKFRISCTRKDRSVECALECELDHDIERAVINEALDDQAADLKYRDELGVSFISINETS